MPTFVEEVQSVPAGDAPAFRRRLAARIEAVGDAVGVLESWTEESREARTELASKYEAAKTLARDEISDAGGGEDGDADGGEDSDADGELDAEGTDTAVSPADLLAHPDVSEGTKQRLREYSTKLHAFLDEERSYGEAREELRGALGAELTLYERLLADLGADAASVRDAQEAVARFAREETPGPANVTAVDLLLDAEIEAES